MINHSPAQLIAELRRLMDMDYERLPGARHVLEEAIAVIRPLAEKGEMIDPLRALEWRCFHCDEVFTTPGAARDHFGATEGVEPGCLVDRVALEEGGTPERGRGLLMALRKAQDEIAQLRREVEELENDSRLWHESEADRIRHIGHCQWWQELDSREGERLALVDRAKKAEAELDALISAPVGRQEHELRAERDLLLTELQNIATANTRDWDDPTDFKAWAQNRARHAIQKVSAPRGGGETQPSVEDQESDARLGDVPPVGSPATAFENKHK